MNAYELAERLEDLQVEYTDDLVHEKCVNMLRHQQNIIEEYIKATDYWMKLCQDANANYSPKADLTDEDLNELCPHHEGTATYSVWMNGARTVLSELAILRKAQEK